LLRCPATALPVGGFKAGRLPARAPICAMARDEHIPNATTAAVKFRIVFNILTPFTAVQFT
jgi:hypothetical protein